MKAICVNPVNVPRLLPLVKPLIKRAATHADLDDYEVIEKKLLAGTFFLWLLCDGDEIYAAVVTRLELTNGVRFLNIVACGGRDLEKWRPLILREMASYGMAEGCRAVRICGRRGWERKLDGYRPIATIYEKELG